MLSVQLVSCSDGMFRVKAQNKTESHSAPISQKYANRKE